MRRREFLATCAASSLFTSRGHAAVPVAVKYRREPSYATLAAFAEPGLDEFPREKIAMEIEARLHAALMGGDLPIAPAPSAYRPIAPDVSTAVFSNAVDIVGGWKKWRQSLGTIRRARFYSLPGDIIRYEIRSENAGRLEYRIGSWKQTWSDGAITRFELLEEIVTHAERPWFRDITGAAFAGARSFHDQLARGTGYWRSRLDPACGIDLYGENGVAVADIDGDGIDEIYVCQSGGLPNRLYKNDGTGRLRDITTHAGLDVLDNTTSALFADLRNSGCQDLVLMRDIEPMLFLNDGKGRFTLLPNAFRFASQPQGTFTSVAAADYDRDGRLDLYLCCYFYFQSEAQYRYPVPYHDARNGPPNFLFRNRLDQSPGYFEDVTAVTGMGHNNDRFTFAASWCDYNGDGWPDLYVTNDFGRKNLYRNTNGHFRDVAEEAGVDDIGPGMSAAWLDYDGDGRPDILVSNMWTASGQRVTSDPAFAPVKQDPSLKEAYRRHVKGNSLYHNNGDGTFTYTGDSQGIEMGHWSWSCDGCDLDNDGVPEIYIACGMLTNNSTTDLMSYFYRQVVAKSPVKAEAAAAYENGWNAINQLIRQDYSWSGREPNVFYARRGDRYYDFSGVSGLDDAEDSRAFAYTDIDGDGNLDLIVKSRLAPQVRVFQNVRGVMRKKIVLALRGTKSNRDAIGARVEVDGQVKWLTAGSGYVSQHTKRLHFGLNDRDRAEKIRILWPSGEVQYLPPLAAGFLYEVTEGLKEYRSTPLKPPSELASNVAFAVDNEARTVTTWLREPVPLPEKRRGPALLFIHAGEPAPRLPVPLEFLDVRQAPADIVASYAIFRRYLFDYRVDLSTPLWFLIDAQSRVRKIYAEAPDAATAQADLRSVDGPVPDPRALPFPGVYHGHPTRDYYKFGASLLQAGYAEQALPYLEEMLRRSPDNPKALLAIGRAWNELGDAASQSGNVAEGERLYRRALSANPKDGEAANSLGLLLAKQGHSDEARKLFEQAISIRRDDSSAINNLGVLYINIGQVNDAIAAFQYGIRVAPDDDILYMNLARIWVRLGDRDKARGVMRDLLARKPGSEAAQKGLKELEVP